MKSHFRTLATLLATFFFSTTALALKVDIGPDNGRKDVLTPEAENWVFKDAPSTTFHSGLLTFTLRPSGGGQLSGVLWKGGLDTGATLATDGLTIKGGTPGSTLELTIIGLTPGHHTLTTYHNLTENIAATAVGHITLSINGQPKITNLKPSVRTANDDDAATAYMEFEATANTPVVITIKYEGAGGGGTGVGGAGNAVILNGFELDTINPQLKALKPQPTHNDEHTIENPTLTWSPPKTATSHDLYLGTDPAAVANATRNSPEFQGNQKSTTFPTKNLDPWLTYFWRVDELNTDPTFAAPPTPTHGDTWRFRIRQLAFPGAEGYGRFARGGRAGKLYEVTTLADSGPGSLREAVDATGPRTIVFRVGGTIDLKSKLVVSNPYCTIAGQTAPGDGILLAHYTVAAASTHDVILRYLRIRISDETGETLDGTGFANCDNCIMDHCSVSWSIDEAFSSRSAKNITLQRTIISEALNMSVHSHYVGTGKGHSFAGSISGDIGSFHHNLLVNDAGRNWSLAGGLSQGGQFAGRLDIRNNVVYNWRHRTTDGGVKELDYVNNYYIPGPATMDRKPHRKLPFSI